MADSNFRSYRSHDPLAHGRDVAPARGQAEDPLAELARLIGQSDPRNDFAHDTVVGAGPAPDDPAAQDWAADDRYAEPNEPAPEQYDERYDPPRLPEPYPPPYRVAPPSHDADYDVPAVNPFSAPRPRLNGAHDEAHGYAAGEPRYRNAPEPPGTREQQLPAFLPRTRDRYEYDDQEQDGGDDQSYADSSYDPEEYEEDAPTARRRGGLVIVAAVLALAVLGTAGAFAYRAMFGASMLPSLPPIIRADNGPNKIVPKTTNTKGNGSDQADASNAASGEKLVSREEKPVDVPAPVNASPRVVSTIPIFPAPDTPPPGVLATGQSGFPAPVASAATPTMPGVSAPLPAAAAAPQASSPLSAEPKRIHTVPIRPDQFGGPDAAGAAPSPPQPSARATAPRPAAPPMPKAAAAPALPAGANAPLSIVPSQGQAPGAAPARTRMAVAQPTSLSPSAVGEAAPTSSTLPTSAAAGGGYAVQVTSQRSEADAQTAFRALQAKYPTQLGGHQSTVRRADLGSKGVYYRALVGPFASMEQAAGLCSSLKAAGGNCIVQRN
jgi:hypothetical protein